MFGHDDTLEVFGIHGFGGAIGALLTGVFATAAINPIVGPGSSAGLIEGGLFKL